MEPAQSNSKKKIIAALIVLVAIALLAISAKALTAKDDASQNTAQTPTPSRTTTDTDTPPATSTDDAAAASYKDGTYTATGAYVSPGGNETIDVSVTLRDGIVTDSTVQEGASDPEAREYQQDFISGYKTFVTGKNIDDIRLSRVSGSSLTSTGFNSALEKIKDQAKPRS
jgi:uncharacterized protein with FMN-binding domain